jgi:hypothetical protein
MGVSDDQRAKYISGFKNGIESNLVKPSIAIVGRSDTGKSTLINSLIGMDKMPTSWTPTTSIAVYIKHIKDRPDFIKEDAWVFANERNGEKLWNVKRMYDEEYCKNWRIAAGEVDVLRHFGTRQGGGLQTEAGSAIVFIDAPVLLNCDIVDLPGFGTETESDDEIVKAAQTADILVYLSQANGFMRIEDIEYLKENVRNLPVWEKKGENDLKQLANLFVVASQAHTINQGNEIQLNTILKEGCSHFLGTLSSGYWDKRSETSGYQYTEDVVRSRFFTYTTDIPVLCEAFSSNLKVVLETLPGIIEQRAKAFIREYVSTTKPSLEAEIQKYEEVVKDREKYVGLLDEIRKSEVQRAADNSREKGEIKDLISQLKSDSIERFSSYCTGLLNVDTIVSKLKDEKVKNEKGAIQRFASRIQDEMQSKCSSILDENAEELSTRMKEYIEQYGAVTQAVFEKCSVHCDFDAGFAFASSLAKIGIIGGLGAYVAGEAAFWLGSWTFVMGVGGNIALGALALGPVGLAVGLAIAAGLGLVKLFGGGWEKTVAKKLVKSYEDNQVDKKYRDAIKNYWRQTEDAFDAATKDLDEQWDKYVADLENTINEYDIDAITDNIRALKNMESFFKNIPS